MRKVYNGEDCRAIKCHNYEQALDVIKSGAWFRTQSFDFYYRAIPCETHKEMPENVALFHKACVTGKLQYKEFYRLEKSQDANVVIFTGEDLKDLICKELNSWALNMNPKTLRAFSGRSFESYMNSVPKEILLDNGFYKRMQVALESGFVQRIKSMPLEQVCELDEVKNMVCASKDIFDKVVKTNVESQDILETNSRQKFDEAIARTHEIFSK